MVINPFFRRNGCTSNVHCIFPAVALHTSTAPKSLYPTILKRFFLGLGSVLPANRTARFPNQIHLGCGFAKLHLCGMRSKVGHCKVRFLYCYFCIGPDTSAFIIGNVLTWGWFQREGGQTQRETGTSEGKREKRERETRQHFVRLLNTAL